MLWIENLKRRFCRHKNHEAENDEYIRLQLPYRSHHSSDRPDNTVITSKYKWYNFLFIATALQFRRAGNVFFLSIVILLLLGNVIPNLFEVSFTPWGTLAILVFVVGTALINDFVDDQGRKAADREVNMRKIKVVNDDGVEMERTWMSLRVGQVVRIHKNEQIPADIILTKSANKKGFCYIETANIDGETNLKLKSISHDMQKYLKVVGKSSHFLSGVLEYEPPNAFLQFQGKFIPSHAGVEPFSLDFTSMILRGSVLRNTPWIEGFIAYAGKETKLVLSSKETPSKFSRIDVFINRLLLYTLYSLILGTLVSTILLIAWVPNTSQLWYFMNVDTINSFLLPGFLAYFLTFLSLLSNMVPIALYFCLEILNVMNKYLLTQDMAMYHSGTNRTANCRSGNLIAEIGQVTHIFSDKTGTLTNNEMRLIACSLGRIYGFKPTEKSKTPDKMVKTVDLFKDMLHEMQQSSSMREAIKLFLTLIAVCHTVIIDYDEDGNIHYNAEGPDEEALVNAAAELGYKLESTEDNHLVIKYGDQDLAFEVLAINAFSSDRKRMSVIVKDTTTQKITLFMKGADSKVLPLCKDPNDEQQQIFYDQIDKDLERFSSSGLRTLVLATKDVAKSEFEAWFPEFKKAKLAGPRQKLELEKVAELMEADLTLLGITAIEDALQEGVAETITRIREAGIKLIVLTGDKVQTAINIALSANLLDSSMEILKLSEVKPIEEIKSILSKTIKALQDLRNEPVAADPNGGNCIQTSTQAESNGVQAGVIQDSLLEQGDADDLVNDDNEMGSISDKLALVVSGPVLETILLAQKGDKEAEQLFYQLTCIASVVLACRVSPKQKAIFVKMIDKNTDGTPVTLAIGDGANDVAMIQEAKVGVGISGHEGLQATNNADFAISRFKFLSRLLFVHGRWNYYRSCKLILFIAYTWQLTTWLLFLYLFFSMFSGQQIYFQTFYLTFFAWVANSVIVAIVWFERDISDKTLLEYPWSYLEGSRNLLLNGLSIFKASIRAFFHATVVFIAMFVTAPFVIDLQQLGVAAYTASIVAVFARQGVLTTTYIWFTIFAYILDTVFFLSSTVLIDLILEGESFLFANGAGRIVWITSFWAMGTVILTEYAFAWGYHFFKPSPFDALREIDRGYVDGVAEKPRKIKDALHILAETGRNLVYPAKIPLRKLRKGFRKAEKEIPDGTYGFAQELRLRLSSKLVSNRQETLFAKLQEKNVEWIPKHSKWIMQTYEAKSKTGVRPAFDQPLFCSKHFDLLCIEFISETNM